MTKITLLSSEYWKNLVHDLMGLFKVYPVQILFSAIVSIGVSLIILLNEQQSASSKFFILIWSISYFLGTNLLLLIVSEKIENGMAQNSVTAHILFGTSTNQLKVSSFYWIIKAFVVFFKYLFAPILLIASLFQYQNILNKIIAKQELENNE
ncbi:hypothetical protein PSG76_09800 [Enterococcus faecalis]|uniref:hypothetical protein n=1 Tax=Enterococcus faecalis TaxID=1351 RepID=UPI002945BCF5|nr:hypothetical protein [Enterococcus faecalis]ELS0448353.1 hypothetical protein [Enterococcus faecalis]MDV7769729.1 hypothetical protein [Enterococcus faecalis]